MDEEEYIHRTEEQRALKNAKKRAMAAETRSRIAAIQNIPKERRTFEEQKILIKFEDRRTRKNIRSRTRVQECKAEMDRISALDEKDRTKEEQAYLDLNLDRRLRKNLADRLRRKMKKAEKSRQTTAEFIAEKEKLWGTLHLQTGSGEGSMNQGGNAGGIKQPQINNSTTLNGQVASLVETKTFGVRDHLLEQAKRNVASSIMNQYTLQQYANILSQGVPPLLDPAKTGHSLLGNPTLQPFPSIQTSYHPNQNNLSMAISNLYNVSSYPPLILEQPILPRNIAATGLNERGAQPLTNEPQPIQVISKPALAPVTVEIVGGTSGKKESNEDEQKEE